MISDPNVKLYRVKMDLEIWGLLAWLRRESNWLQSLRRGSRTRRSS